MNLLTNACNYRKYALQGLFTGMTTIAIGISCLTQSTSSISQSHHFSELNKASLKYQGSETSQEEKGQPKIHNSQNSQVETFLTYHWWNGAIEGLSHARSCSNFSEDVWLTIAFHTINAQQVAIADLLPSFKDFTLRSSFCGTTIEEYSYPYGIIQNYTSFLHSGRWHSENFIKNTQLVQASVTLTGKRKTANDELVKLYHTPMSKKNNSFLMPQHGLPGIITVPVVTTSCELLPENLAIVKRQGRKMCRDGTSNTLVGYTTSGKRSGELVAAKFNEAILTI